MKRLLTLSVVSYVVALVLVTTSFTSATVQVGGGREIFRYDTFGDEQLWTRTLQMQQVVGNVSPAAALGLGLKVDSAALPRETIKAILAGQVNLNDPAVTRLLLSLDAVVGVMAEVDQSGTVQSVGVTCALCHSTVDDSVTSGIGRRLDGWPNSDLDVGAIIALSPVLNAAQKQVFNSWGPGMYDPRLHA